MTGKADHRGLDGLAGAEQVGCCLGPASVRPPTRAFSDAWRGISLAALLGDRPVLRTSSLPLQREETMNIGPAAVRKAELAKLCELNQYTAATRRVPSGITRRQFARTAAGTAAFGGAIGTGFLKPALANTLPSFAPVPIPGGTPVLGGFYHVFGPASGLLDPIDAEPSTITNLDGFVGLAYVSGMVTRTNTKTGEKLRLPFRESDMRFMKGNFRGTDGNIHKATFALV
jgi:hypothetical protein